MPNVYFSLFDTDKGTIATRYVKFAVEFMPTDGVMVCDFPSL